MGDGFTSSEENLFETKAIEVGTHLVKILLYFIRIYDTIIQRLKKQEAKQ